MARPARDVAGAGPAARVEVGRRGGRDRRLVAVYTYATGTARHDLTTDHGVVRRALRSITEPFDEPYSRFHLSPAEIIDVASGDAEAGAAHATVCRRCLDKAETFNEDRYE